MALVIDASMTLSWCFADEVTPYTKSILETLRRSYAEVPAIWPLEIRNVLLINERHGRITEHASKEFLEVLDIRIDVNAASFLGEGVLTIARRHKLTAYDAAYLELAKRRGFALATLDKDLIKAAPLEGVALVAQL